MTFRASPESINYRDPVSGEFFQRRGTVSESGRIEPLWQPHSDSIQTMEIRPGMIFNNETMPVKPGTPEPELEKMPVKPGTPSSFEFLQDFVSREQNPYGGSPGQEIPREAIEKMGQPGAKPPAGFFEELRRKLGSSGVKEARSPSFDINQGQGALGRRSGEQLLRLQGGSGSMQNQQLQQELERRGIIPRGVQLPPV